MRCNNPNCKHDIPDDSIFCPDCGQKQEETPIPDNRKDDNRENSENQPSPSDNDNQDRHSPEKSEISFMKDGATYYCIGVSSSGEPLSSPHCMRWRHADNCGGNIFLGDNAKCICDKCGAIAPISEWEIVETSDEKIAYTRISKETSGEYDMGQALLIGGETTTVAGIKWLNRFTNSLMQDIDNQ